MSMLEGRNWLSRIRTAMTVADRVLSDYRTQRTNAIREFIGFNHGKEGTSERVPVNLLEMAVQTYTRLLASRSPKALVSTAFQTLKPLAYSLQLALNRLVEQVDLVTTMRTLVVDAMFAPVGVVKVGMAQAWMKMLGDEKVPVGMPFVDTVSFDDFLFDVQAKRFDRMQFAADAFWLPLEAVRNSDMYDPAVTGGLQPSSRKVMSEHGAERADQLTAQYAAESKDSDVVDMVRLWDIWLPLQRQIVTVADDQKGLGPLRVVEYNETERGPYHFLRYNPVPDSILGIPPVALWFDLHEIANRVYVKLGDQAERQKTITAYARGGERDAETIRDAEDGAIVHVDHPEMIKQLTYGGADQQTLLLSTQLRGLFSWVAGNLDSLAGLGPQSGTATQDQMIAQASSQRLNDMRDQTMSFAKGVMEHLAYLLYSHPYIDLPYTRTIPGVDVEIPANFGDEQRDADFIKFNLSIEPFSMAHQSPVEKLGQFMEIWNKVVLPILPVMPQLGMAPNIEGMLKHVGELTGVDMGDLVKFAEPSLQQQVGPIGEASQKPAFTQREVVRRSVPGMSAQGRDTVMAQMMAGNGVQPEQAAAATTPGMGA